MIKIKRPHEIDRMRASCRLAAAVLDQVAGRCAPGVTTAELDAYAAELIAAAGGRSAFLGYRGYPAQICISVNDEVVHGIPNRRRLELGDMVSIDVGVELEGWIGDNARTVAIGVQDPEVLRLLEITAPSPGGRHPEGGARGAAVGHLPRRGNGGGRRGHVCGQGFCRSRRRADHARGAADPEFRAPGPGAAAAGRG